MKYKLLFLTFMVCFGKGYAQTNIALGRSVFASSVSSVNSAPPEKIVDGIVSDTSKWVSESNKDQWIMVVLNKKQPIGGMHIYFGNPEKKPVEDFFVQFYSNGKWNSIPSATVSGNSLQNVQLAFDETIPVITDSLRVVFVRTKNENIIVREIAIWANSNMGIPVLGTGVIGFKGTESAYVPKIYLNQTGFDKGKPKRFTVPFAENGKTFFIYEKGSNKPVYSGKIHNKIGDFSKFNPNSNKDFVVVVDTFKSFPFRIGMWWIERVTYQNAVDFMIDSRHYVGNYTKKCVGSYGWRDDSHFGWELNTLVPQYLSNPSVYERMPRQIKYQASNDTNLWGKLQPYDDKAPDIVKLIHWGADVIVSQNLTHENFKGQLAYFLYAWPYLQKWLPIQNYQIVKQFVIKEWQRDTIDKKYAYNESFGHNMLSLKTKIGSTKGALPPGASIIPNLMMFEVAKRDGDSNANIYWNAAYNQVQWIINNLDWNDPLTTKGQRMSEFITMTSLAYMLNQYPTLAPKGLKRKINDWANVIIRRSNNMWDFRKFDDKNQWVPTGNSPQQWNETGNILGLPAAILSMIGFADNKVTADRLMEIAYAHLDNSFGRNPVGRQCSFAGPKEIEGVDLGWYSQYIGGIGQLENARFVLEGSPKNAHYPFHPEKGNIGWSEGWVSFNVAFNISLAYMAWNDTRISLQKKGDRGIVNLIAPINFDYNSIEFAKVDVKYKNGEMKSLLVKETDPNSGIFMARLENIKNIISVSYGYGYFKKSAFVDK